PYVNQPGYSPVLWTRYSRHPSVLAYREGRRAGRGSSTIPCWTGSPHRTLVVLDPANPGRSDRCRLDTKPDMVTRCSATIGLPSGERGVGRCSGKLVSGTARGGSEVSGRRHTFSSPVMELCSSALELQSTSKASGL